jgi:DhnA family fructose-bisphosphate aldolase class Ia
MPSLGKINRLNRLFNLQSGSSIIIPMDHGVEGYFAELENPIRLIASLVEAGADGFLMRRGLAAHSASVRGRTGWVARITKRTGVATAQDPRYDLDQLLTGSVEQALRNGADAVVPTFFLGEPYESKTLPMLGAISDECNKLGMPLCAEVFPVGGPEAEPYNGPYSLDDMRVTVRVASEIGADFIKTWYSGDSTSFRKIVAYSTIPVLIAGGPKANSNLQVLEMIKGAMEAGAKGTVVGRKIWQSPNPPALVHAIRMIVHEGADVGAAMRGLG